MARIRWTLCEDMGAALAGAETDERALQIGSAAR